VEVWSQGTGSGRNAGEVVGRDAHAESLGVTRCDSEKSVGNRREETEQTEQAELPNLLDNKANFSKFKI
jgi:hypothetical protein